MSETWHTDFNPQKFLSRVSLAQLIERNETYNGISVNDAKPPCIFCGKAAGRGILLNDKSFLCQSCYSEVAMISYPERYETLRRQFVISREARRLAWEGFRERYETLRRQFDISCEARRLAWEGFREKFVCEPEDSYLVFLGWFSLLLALAHPAFLILTAILLVIGYTKNGVNKRKTTEWLNRKATWEQANPEPQEPDNPKSSWEQANPEPQWPELKHFHDPSAALSEKDKLVLKIFNHWPGYPPFWQYLRSVVIARDSRCQVTGCPSRLALHVHHMRPVASGGPHTPDNLVSLCAFHHALEPEKGHERIWEEIKTKHFTLVCDHERSNRASHGTHTVKAHLRRLQLVTVNELLELTKTYGFCCPSCSEPKINFTLLADKNVVRVQCPTCNKSTEGAQQLTEETGPMLAEILAVSRNKGRWKARWDMLAERTSTTWGVWSGQTVSAMAHVPQQTAPHVPAADISSSVPSRLSVTHDNDDSVLRNAEEAVAGYRKSAEQGHAWAQFNLGMAYDTGNGVTKDAVEAVKWYRKSAEQGDATAQYWLGLAYFYGNGVTKDFFEAYAWFVLAGVGGSEKAREMCSDMLKKMTDEQIADATKRAKDTVGAAQCLRESAEQGNAKAQLWLGRAYDEGNGVAKDSVEAVKWYRKSAEQGNARAQFNLGLAYDLGDGVLENPEEAVKWYRESAEQGNADAQVFLGMAYDDGNGVPKDSVEAVKWFRKSAEQGDASAQFNLGLAYFYGTGVTKDSVEAVEWYRKSAEQGNAVAQDSLGGAYADGVGVTKDSVEAMKWYRISAEQGNARAQFNLGLAYDLGDGVKEDSEEAVKWWRKSAEQGDASAQFSLGRAYISGNGVAKDSVEAVKWYRKSAEQGNAKAQFWLGWAYDLGIAMKQDSVEAVTWYRKSAEQGNAGAQCHLGRAYFYGEGVTEDPVEAVKWWRKSAEQEDASGQFSLGMAYDTGNGVTKDSVEAVEWYRKSAEQGYTDAQHALGMSYSCGEGVQKDYVEAVNWWRKSAEQGNAKAQFFLGLAFASGNGVTEDRVEAYAWFIIADEGGYEGAQTNRDLIGNEMTKDQIAEATNRAKELVATIRK